MENGSGDNTVNGLSWEEGACATASERICGFQIRMDPASGFGIDDTNVNDLKFFCCDGYPGI